MDDAAEIHDMDQTQATMRQFAESLARDVGTYRTTLIECGIPDTLADRMAERFNDGWIKTQVEASVGIGVTTLYMEGE